MVPFQNCSCLQALTVVAGGNTDLQPGTSGRACLCWGHRPRFLVCAAGQKLVHCSLGALHGPADVRLVHTLREGEQFTQLAQASQVMFFGAHILSTSALAWKLAVTAELPDGSLHTLMWASQMRWHGGLLWWADYLLAS